MSYDCSEKRLDFVARMASISRATPLRLGQAGDQEGVEVAAGAACPMTCARSGRVWRGQPA